MGTTPRYIHGAGPLLALLLFSSAPHQIRAEGLQARPAPRSPARATYTARQIRDISIFGARLAMPLEEARAALVGRGFTRQAYPDIPPVGHEAQVLEAEYRHPSDNTSVGLFYSELPNGERRIGRIVLWEQIPIMERASFGRFVTERYGAPTIRSASGGHVRYVWSQGRASWPSLQRSIQCMMNCLPANLVGRCGSRTISGQVVMSGGFNTNMPGELYWFADLNDLTLQRSAMLWRGSYPEPRPACPIPVF